MRKFILLILMVSSVFVFVSCARDPEMVNVEILSEDISYATIDIEAAIGIELESLNELEEIAYSIASQTYESHAADIGTKRMTLTIMLSSEQFDYGSITFHINYAIENPGLSLASNDLIFN